MPCRPKSFSKRFSNEKDRHIYSAKDKFAGERRRRKNVSTSQNICQKRWQRFLFADSLAGTVALGGEEKKMDVDLIFKIAAIGIIVAVLNQVLIRSGREEQAMMTTLAGLIVVLMMIINEINTLFETGKTIFGLG